MRMLTIYLTATIDQHAKEYKNILKAIIPHRLVSSPDQADIIIAEVTDPSKDTAREIGYALDRSIPVLALLQAAHPDKISSMLTESRVDSFFLEHYSEGNLGFILKDFIEYIQTLKKRKGKLIVLDGGDASGKTTQAKLLVEYLTKHHTKTRYFDFPQYYTSFHGDTVAKFLRGEFGSIDEVSPYLSSLAYALDRASVRREMEVSLNKGEYIVSNRYATSSIAYQSAKFVNKKEREEFIRWIYDLEYKVDKIPKEDIVIYLRVPWQIGAMLRSQRSPQPYLKGKRNDIHEDDHTYLKKTEAMYDELAKRYSHWVMIDCAKNGSIDSVESIHKKILRVLKEKKFI